MLGLLKAAVLLAPALELVWAATPEAQATSNREDITSSSLIVLAWEDPNNSALQQTTLDFRVFESATPCGDANVTLNGEPLSQDDDSGFGSGTIPTESGSVLAADWKFTCVHLEQDSEVQLLSVRIVSVDGQEVEDVAFSVEFQQIAPVFISYIERTPTKSKSPPVLESSDDQRPSLDDELAELEMLKEQLFALEHSIALKITHISDLFNLDQPEKLLEVADCGGLRCFLSTMYGRMKAMANKLYHSGQGEGSQATRPEIPKWSSRYGSQRPLIDIDRVKKLGAVSSLQGSGSVSTLDAVEDPTSIADNDASRLSKPQQPFVDEPRRVLHILVLVIVGLAIVINLIVMVLIFQCVRLLRQRRKARWEKRRAQLRRSREDCNALVATKYLDLLQWLRDGLRREGVEDQEKDAMMRQLHESDQDDTMSTTMEEEIAQFRAAASAVGNLVSAGEGRGRSRLCEHLSLTRPRRASTPSSIMSSCPTYRSVDESLPAYDEHRSPEYVVDGFQYTPGSSTCGSSSPRGSTFGGSTTRSSLDENAERKE